MTGGELDTSDWRPRIFPSGWSRRERRAYGAVAAYFLLVFVGLGWPVYPAFAGIRPFVLGLPFSLAYLVVLLVGSFLVLLGLYLWEGRTGRAGGAGPRTGRGHRAGQPGAD